MTIKKFSLNIIWGIILFIIVLGFVTSISELFVYQSQLETITITKLDNGCYLKKWYHDGKYLFFKQCNSATDII